MEDPKFMDPMLDGALIIFFFNQFDQSNGLLVYLNQSSINHKGSNPLILIGLNWVKKNIFKFNVGAKHNQLRQHFDEDDDSTCKAPNDHLIKIVQCEYWEHVIYAFACHINNPESPLFLLFSRQLLPYFLGFFNVVFWPSDVGLF